MNKESDIDIERDKYLKKFNEQQDEIDSMLSYGSVNLGLNDIKRENSSKERVKEDLKK